MFFDEENLAATKKVRIAARIPPPIPPSNWRPPDFPDLSAAKRISVDVETYEPDFDHGPGWGRSGGRGDKGHIVGASIGAVDAFGNRGSWYFPVRHIVETQYNMSPEHVFNFLRDNLQTPNIPKVTANGLYDLGWLTEENIYVEGEMHDVQFAEALLNETGKVALDGLGIKYLNEGKATDDLYVWLAQAYGGDANSGQRANIYRSPPQLAGPYAQSDADLPLRVLEKQLPLLDAAGLGTVYRMECDLMRLLVRMRLRGVRVDIPAAEELYGRMRGEVAQLYQKMRADFGYSITSVDSGEQLAELFKRNGVKFPTTAKGQPSFKKEWLKALDNPLGKAVNEIRERQKLSGTFLKSYLLERNTDGRVHCSFHPLRSDDGGTRSGRLSSSDPNLQNIPVRSELGKLLRKLFLPDHGHIAIERNDYSQIEYRFLAHFAVGKGADLVRQAYVDDPTTDYHDLTIALVKAQTGQTIDRKPIKNINFGLLYGMGVDKLARQIGIDKKTAKGIFAAYHEGAPYVQSTMDAASQEAQALGYVDTIMGRRSQFEMWEPIQVNYDNRARALPYQLAVREYGTQIQRAHTHKAINRRLQGSAADMMKFAMLMCDRAGVFDYTGVPLLTVHDELVFSVPNDSPQVEAAYVEMRRILAHCMPLRVPVIVSSGRGGNWGEAD